VRFSLAPLLLVAACGGGGGGALPPAAVAFSFAVVRADEPTTRTIRIPNALLEAVSVELAEPAAGPFAPAAGELPAATALDEDFFLDVVFTPPDVGEHEGEIVLRLRGVDGSGVRDVVLTLDAMVEAPALQAASALVDFGDVLAGEALARVFRFSNPTEATPVEIQAVAGLPAGFTLTTALPRTLPPAQSTDVEIRYEPEGLADLDFEVSINHTAAAEPLRVRVLAETTTWIPEIISDFGSVPVAGGETAWLEVDVPPHAVSLSIEALTPTSVSVGLLGLEGPSGEVFENDTATGPFLWTPGDDGVFTSTVPNSDRAAVQLVEGGGTYRFRLYAFQGSAGSFDVRAIVRNRPGGVLVDGVLDLNVFLATGLGIPASAAPTQTRLQAILGEVDRILGFQGLTLGEIAYYVVDDPAFDNVSGGELPSLLRTSDEAADTRLNLFFAQRVLGGGVLGVAARVPGPALGGTRASGVVVDYDFGGASTAGSVSAHEICHYLGLFHTVESNGAHDLIDDTLECPANGTNATCPTEGAGYLMHWRVLDVADPVITDGQAGVILAHPFVEAPSALAGLALRLPPDPPATPDALPDGWCGTPGCRPKGVR